MKRLKDMKAMFIVACVFQTIMSGTILLMPLASSEYSNSRDILVIVGGIFWISFIAGYVSLYRCISLYKKSRYKKTSGPIGMFRFFTGIPAITSDIILILSTVLFFIISFTSMRDKYVAYILLFLVIWSVNMHCMLNGKIYKVIKEKTRRKSDEKE